MKEFVISEVRAETAVLVGLVTKTQDERKTNEYLDELAFLAETAGAEVVKRFTKAGPGAFRDLRRQGQAGRNQRVYPE